MLKYNDISMNPVQAMVLENRMPDRINNQNGMSPTEGEMCRVGSLPDAAMMSPSSGMSPSEQYLSPAEGISPSESDVSSPNGLGARTGAPVSLAANETRAASAQALYDTIRPEKTVWDKAAQVVAGRPTHTTTWSDGDAITQQKQAAMQRYSHVPQWIFDLAEKKARTGESVGISDILAAALSGAGWGASQALTKGVALSMQGVNDSYANPVGLAQRAINAAQGNGFEVMTPTVEADGIAERALTESAHYLTDGLPVLRALSTAVKAVKPIAKAAESANVFVRTPARAVQTIAEPLPVGYEMTGLMGAAGLTTAVEPETPWGQIATGIIGGMAAPLVLSGMKAGLNGIKNGIWHYQTEKGLNGLLQKAKEPGSFKDVVDFQKADAWLTDQLKKQGFDIAGYNHSVDVSALKHINKNHGNVMQEAQRGQIAITGDDIKRIPDIVKRPDYITLGNKTSQNKDAITYVKNAPEGTTYYVEEIRNKRRRLSGDTMYKRKGAPVQPAAGLINSPTGLNALSDTGRILNIYYPNTVVKGINNFQPFISTAMTGGSLSGMYKLLSHDKDQEGAPTQPAAELIQFPASPNVRNDVGRILNIDYPNAVVKGGEEALFEEELPRSRMCTYQAHQSGYTAGDSSLRPAGGEADQEIAYFTPSVKRENEITSSCVRSPAQEPLTAVSDLLTYDIDPTGAEALLDAGLDEKEILSRHRAYDTSLSEVTAQRILGSDAASSRLKALKETLSGMLPGLKEASRRQGHRFYSEAPSVQSRLLEEAYLTAMEASADDVSVPEAHRLMGQGRKEAAYGVHGGPYYQDDLSDFWHMIAAV